MSDAKETSCRRKECFVRHAKPSEPPITTTEAEEVTRTRSRNGVWVKQRNSEHTREIRRNGERGGGIERKKDNLGSGGMVLAAGVFVTVGGGGWGGTAAPRERRGGTASGRNGGVAARDGSGEP